MDGDAVKLYTWKDAERTVRKYMEENRMPFINSIDVYSDEIIVEVNERDKGEKNIDHIMEQIFGNHFNRKTRSVDLELFHEKLNVFVEYEEKKERKQTVSPLFHKLLYKKSSYEDKMLHTTLDKCPVIAFHSYKG